jgi:hypothetical protein
MKILLFFLTVFAAGCSRPDRWSVAAVRDESDQQARRLRVEVQTKEDVPWPLRLSVAARDASGTRIESSLQRWTAREVAPGRVAFTFVEPVTSARQPVTFDLKISASGRPNLTVRHLLGPN